jgi:hypothetical protein
MNYSFFVIDLLVLQLASSIGIQSCSRVEYAKPLSHSITLCQPRQRKIE